MEKIYKGLYYTMCNLNLQTLNHSVQKMEPHLTYVSKYGKTYESVNNIPYRKYNVLSFPYPEFHKLYKIIQKSFYEVEKLEFGCNLNYNYYISSWINVLGKNKRMFKHGHFYNCNKNWHGFFCLYTEPGFTYYVFNDGKTVDIPNIDNKLVLGLTGDSEHYTHPWQNDLYPRITIAFDIIPDIYLKNMKDDRWVPI